MPRVPAREQDSTSWTMSHPSLHQLQYVSEAQSVIDRSCGLKSLCSDISQEQAPQHHFWSKKQQRPSNRGEIPCVKSSLASHTRLQRGSSAEWRTFCSLGKRPGHDLHLPARQGLLGSQEQAQMVSELVFGGGALRICTSTRITCLCLARPRGTRE